MRSESPREARDRFHAIRNAEEDGIRAASEGQAQPSRTGATGGVLDAGRIRLDDPETMESARLGSSAEIETRKAELAEEENSDPERARFSALGINPDVQPDRTPGMTIAPANRERGEMVVAPEAARPGSTDTSPSTSRVDVDGDKETSVIKGMPGDTTGAFTAANADKKGQGPASRAVSGSSDEGGGQRRRVGRPRQA
jgi:hypothetical protein